jgi:hypothetical protein
MVTWWMHCGVKLHIFISCQNWRRIFGENVCRIPAGMPVLTLREIILVPKNPRLTKRAGKENGR